MMKPHDLPSHMFLLQCGMDASHWEVLCPFPLNLGGPVTATEVTSYDFQMQVIKNKFLSCSLGKVFLGTLAPCHERAETKWRDIPPTARLRFQHDWPDLWVRIPLDDLSPPSLNLPQHWGLPHWGPRHCGAETSCPRACLNSWPEESVRYKKLSFQSTKFLVKLSHSNIL